MKKAIVTGLGLVLFAAMPVAAHHSDAMFDSSKEVTVSGTVKESAYVNPHSWLYVLVTDDRGEETLWGFDSSVESNTLDVFIRLLRGKIDQPGEARLIHTVRGVGYRMRER